MGGHIWKKLSRKRSQQRGKQSWEMESKSKEWLLDFVIFEKIESFLGNYFEVGFCHVWLKECWLKQRLREKQLQGTEKGIATDVLRELKVKTGILLNDIWKLDWVSVHVTFHQDQTKVVPGLSRALYDRTGRIRKCQGWKKTLEAI